METVVEDVLLHYEIINPKAEKDCLVLHGWGHSSAHWLSVVQKSSTEFRYIVLDLPGFGRSQFISGNASVPEYASLIAGIIAKTKLSKPVIIGHSFGGQIATLMAIEHSVGISKLILIAPSSIRQRSFKQKTKVLLFRQFSLLKIFLPPSILRRLLRFVSTTDYFNATSRHKEILKQIIEYDLFAGLHKINVPVKVIWGSADEAIPVQGKLLVEQIQNAELYVMYGVGHNPHVFNREALVQLINDCLTLR